MIDRTIDRLDAFALRHRRLLSVLGGIWLVISWVSAAQFISLPEIPFLTGKSAVFASSGFAALWWGWINPRIAKRRTSRAADNVALEEFALMSGAGSFLDDADQRARWDNFQWTDANAKLAAEIIGRYPPGRQHSASIPLLDLAQRQVGAETNTQGWLPIPVMEFVGKQIGMPYVRVLEVATFYTMFNLAPVGRFHVQVCGTTPCMLRGSDDVLNACYKRGLKKGRTTEDGLFTLTEVECLGACANAPMVQINDDNYEDLTEASMGAILDALAAGKSPKPGPQVDRQTSCPEGGPTSLKKMAERNYDYRPQWTASAEEGAQ